MGTEYAKEAFEQNSGFNGIRTHDCCDSDAKVLQLNYEVGSQL